MADMQNIEMGPCALTLGDTAVGHTLGPVKLNIEPVWRPRREARYGETVIDCVYLGSRVRVTAVIAEKTLANLKAALPAGTDGGTYLGLGRSPGLRLSAVAQLLTLHPLECAGTDRDITLHKAAATGAVEVPFADGAERAFQVEFVALFDATQDEGERLAKINRA